MILKLKWLPLTLLFHLFFLTNNAQKNEVIPNTGISGIYEVLFGTKMPEYHIKYFAEFGFSIVDSGTILKEQALKLYGVNNNLKSYRLQNGEIDSHGLLRLLVWETPISEGVGYTEPESIGSRMTVMKTKDIVRIYDIFKMLRTDKQEKWLPTEPFFDDPLHINKNGETGFFKRPIGVRENAIYGDFFTHVFFQRYGYEIPGYGTINKNTPLKTSEFTHHDWFIKVDSMQQLMYLQTALGLKAEKMPEIDGDWLKGPKAVFKMEDGYTHWYQGFVSPNNICGKLKFFMPRGAKPNRDEYQKIGALGVTLHSFYTSKLEYVFELVSKHSLKPLPIATNEFGERSFVFIGPGNVAWQILEKLNEPKNKPIIKTEFEWTKD